MASLVVAGDTSGSVTLAAPAISGSTTLTLPTTTGTLVVTSGAQTIEFADGSASAPSITNSGDTNTGIFFPAADTIAFTEGGVESMRIDSSGNVGIGTTSGGKLNVAGNFSKNTGDENTWGIRVTDETAMAAGVGGGMVFVGNYTSGGGKASFGGIAGAKENATTSNGLGQLRFYTTDVSSILQERMRIDSSGRLLVGLTSALGNGLSVSSAGNTIYAQCTSSSQSVSVNWNSGNNTGTSADLVQLGVGTSSFTSVGTISYNGTLTVYSTTSDQRLKENIVNSQSGLEKLANVKIRAFDWKEHGNHTDFGVIAQELYEVAPEAVVKGDEDAEITKTWKVDTAILVPAMIKAIQEQQAIITDLKARIETLENK